MSCLYNASTTSLQGSEISLKYRKKRCNVYNSLEDICYYDNLLKTNKLAKKIPEPL
jgi:hypothetical protein